MGCTNSKQEDLDVAEQENTMLPPDLIDFDNMENTKNEGGSFNQMRKAQTEINEDNLSKGPRTPVLQCQKTL